MRAQVRQDAGTLIAPGRVAHEARRAVAVEHPAAENPAERALVDQLAHAVEVRLEAMIVGGVADDAVAARARLQIDDGVFVLAPQRLLDEDVLLMIDAIA